MKNLTEIIGKMSKVEKRYYKLFADRVDFKKEKKVVQLFECIQNEKYVEDSEELINLLFPNGSKNSYYRLKNRLLEDLNRSLLLQHINIDERNSVLSMISLSNIYANKNQYKQAIYYLKRAERKALAKELFDLLDLIYSEVLSIARHYDDIDPNAIILKRKEIADKYSVIREADEAVLAVNYQLRRTNFSGKEIEVQKTLKKILDGIAINKEIYKLPRVKLKIHECVRNSFLQAKDFHTLEGYLLKSFKDFNKEKIFSQVNHLDKIILISWIVNTLSKNKKFAEALKYSDILFSELLKYNKLYFDKYSWTYYQSLSINNFFLGKLKTAIEIAEKVVLNPQLKGNQFYDLGVYLTLSSQHYCQGDISKAIKTLSPIIIKDTYNNLSSTWQLNISIVEMILHYENGDIEYAFTKLKEIKRTFNPLLKDQAYTKEVKLLDIFSLIVKHPDPFGNKSVNKKIDDYLKLSQEMEPGANDVINYNAWLISKVKRQDYYQVILQMVD